MSDFFTLELCSGCFYHRPAMKYKSHIVTQASGSIGGTTYSNNRSGLYMRARSIPTNPQTALQTVIRNAFSTLSTRWGTLTDDQRSNWAIYANNAPVKNTLGDSIKLTGQQMYLRCNTPRIQAALGVIDDAPTLFTTAAIEGAVLSQAVLTPFAISLAVSISGLTGSDTLLVYASTAKSPTINFFKGPYQFNTQLALTSGTVPLVPNPTWVEGQRIFVRAQITYADARLSPDWTGALILTATPV